MNSLMHNRRGLTLVEMLVVVAIIGVLVALLLPAVQSARETARRTSCGNKLKQVGLALNQHSSLRGRLPEGGVSINALSTKLIERDYDDPSDGPRPENRMVWAGASWMVLILPFFEEKSLADAYNPSLGALAGSNTAVTSQYLPALICPSHPSVAPGSSLLVQPADLCRNGGRGDYSQPLPSTAGFRGFEKGNYAVNVGAGMLQRFSDTTNRAFKGPFSVVSMYGAPPAALRDGASNTVLASEIANAVQGGGADSRGAWGWPGGATFCGRGYANVVLTPNTQTNIDNSSYSNNDFFNPIFNLRNGGDTASTGGTGARSFHAAGCNCVFADGSLRFVSDQIDPATYLSLLAIADGAVVGDF